MSFVTLEVGPTWRMQLLRGLLDARGLPAIVQDDSLSAYIGDAPSSSRLQVPEEVVDVARTVVADARREGSWALEGLRYARHERVTTPRPLRAMLLDAAFWAALILTAFFVFSWLFLPARDPG